MTKASIAYGTLIQWSDGASPPVWTTLAEVNNITGPGMSRELPDATHTESPGGRRERLLVAAAFITVELRGTWLDGPETDAQTKPLKGRKP